MTGIAGLLDARALRSSRRSSATRVELVYVDVFVTQKRRAGVGARGRRTSGSRTTGLRKQVEVVDRRLVPTTAVLVLDTSASVAGGNLVHLQEAARAFLAGSASATRRRS